MNVLRGPRLFLVLLALLVSGCAAEPNSQAPLFSASLNPYLTATSVVVAVPTVAATELPVPTATASVYKVAPGDTMSGIAQRFGIRLDDLAAANPGVVPEALSVGQTLKIPAASPSATGSSVPAPAAAEVGRPQCYPSGAGLYCLAPVHNPFPRALENISLLISLLDPAGRSVASQQAFLPLDILPPDSTLPAYAFFPASAVGLQPVAQLLTAIRLTPGDTRYLPALPRNVLVSVDWNGRSAQAQGQIFLAASSRQAHSAWLAAVAYDREGLIVGFRRWEWQGKLQAANVQPFAFSVYSLGPVIERVEVIVEARP